jgi:hypothetical protein
MEVFGSVVFTFIVAVFVAACIMTLTWIFGYGVGKGIASGLESKREEFETETKVESQDEWDE